MKAILKSVDQYIDQTNFTETDKIGQEIEFDLVSSYSGISAKTKKDGCYLPINFMESPVERLKRLAETSPKMLLHIPTTGFNVDVIQTEKHLIVYGHRKGSRHNVFGKHYYYFHDVETGEFIPHLGYESKKTDWKQRLLKKDAISIQEILNKKIV